MRTACLHDINNWRDTHTEDTQWRVKITNSHVFGYHREFRYYCCGLRRAFKAVPIKFSNYCEAKGQKFVGCQFSVAWLFVVFGIASGCVTLEALRRRQQGSFANDTTTTQLLKVSGGLLALPPVLIFLSAIALAARFSGLNTPTGKSCVRIARDHWRISSVATIAVVSLVVIVTALMNVDNQDVICEKVDADRFPFLQCDEPSGFANTTMSPTTSGCIDNKIYDACSTVNFVLILTFAGLQFVVAIVAMIAVCWSGKGLPCLRGWDLGASYTFHGPSEIGFPMTLTLDNDHELLDEITRAVEAVRQPMLAHRRPVYTSYAGKNEMIAVGAAFEDDAREETEDLPAKRESSDTYNRGLTAQHSRMPLDGAVVTEMAI